MEFVLSDSIITRRTYQVEHVTIESQKGFEVVKAALESSLPQFDASILVLLRYGESARVKKELERTSGLCIFLSRDHGGLLQIQAQRKKAVQYEIGNAYTASRMTQHRLPVALYAPLRVILFENAHGHAVLEYDRPSSLFGQYGDEKVIAIARELDQQIESVLREAAECL